MFTVMSKKQKMPTRQAQRQIKQQKLQQQRIAKKRTTIWISVIVGLIVVAVAAIILSNALNNKSVLASDNPSYPVIDNEIACQTNEQLAYHIHAHLSIYMDGQPFSLPATIGIASDQSCIYWLHTHKTDGIIHIESPNANTYSLGTFFKLWQDHFSQLGYPSQLSTTDGWKVYVDGKPYTGDFHKIKLTAHELVTLAYNSPNITPDTTYSWGDL